MKTFSDTLFFPWASLIASIILLILTIISLKIVASHLRDSSFFIRDLSKTHSWREIRKAAEHPWWCSICESLLMNFEGFYCDSCGVASDSNCFKRADKELKCRPVSMAEPPVKHHWVRGNLREIGECIGCGEEAGVEAGIVDWRCAWCQALVHTLCKDDLSEECDFGDWSRFIVSPLDVKLEPRSGALLPLRPRPGSTPLFLVGNNRSGCGELVEGVLSCLRGYLNGEVQVMVEVERWGLIREALGKEGKGWVVAVGGDGTVSSLLTSLKESESKGRGQPVPVGVLPLGTGNDLSRALGWGHTLPIPFAPYAFLQALTYATEAKLDRWSVAFKGRRGRGKKAPMFMYNYLSIGVDARVALNFHNTRRSPLYPTGSSFLNKALYLCFGTQQVVERECQGLEERIDLWLDGIPSPPLPPLEAIVILNIPFWGAGVKLWPDEGQSMSDGILEVVGIYSSFHIAQLQVGLSKAHVIGQASKVKIRLKTRSAVQVDGEPWMENPTEMMVTRDGQATVLVAPPSPSPNN